MPRLSTFRFLPLLRPLLDHPGSRRALRILFWGGTFLYFSVALLLLGLRYAVLPQIENYRGDIEHAMSAAIHQPVSIRAVKAHWSGLRPVLKLHGINVHDTAGRPVLGFDQVTVEPAWNSLWHWELRLARLELAAPQIVLRRDRAGRLFAAGLDITPQKDTDTGFAHWLLSQHRIIIRNATVIWQDELRNAPPLELRKLNLRLDNGWRAHRFGLTAEPPRQLATQLDIRGEFKGRDIQQLKAWAGRAYANIAYADLAGWRAWIDYPLAMPQGSGALRLWLNFAQAQITAVTADVRLADVRLQLRPDLPELDLLHLDGRLTAERLENGFAASTKQLTLATRDGAALPATDFSLRWQTLAQQTPQGSIEANTLDFGALGRLASHLPLAEATRAQLTRHAPQGKLFDLTLNWRGGIDKLETWFIKSRFEKLGFNNLGPIAAISNISGQIEGSDQGGNVQLDGKNSHVDLPTIFAEPRAALDTLAAEARWENAADGLHINLQKATFANQDAAGEASGSWHALANGPGKIDLVARLTRARGSAVWRYMPRVIGQDTRDWLRTGILGGTASEVTLTLKGDLHRFPFRGGPSENQGGLFEVRGKFSGATLSYAAGWPDITGIDGELLFAGERMLITGKTGRIFNVDLHDVRAEIADLETLEELLTVTGKATGPTTDFLRYIEASPVGEHIDHFTEEMKATGNGELDIKLDLPLRLMEHTKIAGKYRFDGNRLTVDADLPPLTDVRGQLQFSTGHLEARDMRGALLGMPLTATVKTTADGGVQVTTAGDLSVAALRRQFAHPALDNLSGNAKWNGTVRIRKKIATLNLSSNLVGISSSLPEPFNKTTTETLAMSIERRTASGTAAAEKVGADDTAMTAKGRPSFPREMLNIRLGQRAQLQLVRRQDTNPPRITWGQLRIGDMAEVKEVPRKTAREAMRLDVNLPRIDANAWWHILGGNGSASGTSGLLADLPNIQFDLRTTEFTLLEQTLRDVRLTGLNVSGAQFNPKFELKSRELNGDIEWQSGGKGHLTAHIDKFALPKPQAPTEILRSRATEVIDQLPALDISVADFSFDGRPLGNLRLTAENEASLWNARIDISNDDDNLHTVARWRPHTAEETQIDFNLKTKNIDRFLQRIGYADVIRRGSATASGALGWRGPPFRIDYPSLSGKFRLDAANGQFNKLEPGVGRLLGILSLQSLPRRITLDFRDVFSEGFAFNEISGDFNVTRGVTQTDNLHIRGPAANVLMNGAIDLDAETQNLKVLIQPAVSDSVSVGALIANPAVGAAVWAAQKLFKDPLGKVFAYEYQVTGPWADPQVVKSRQALPKIPAAAAPAGATE